MPTASLYKKWARDNPRESAAVEAFWEEGGRRPATRTAFGFAWASVAEAYDGAYEGLPFPIGDVR